MAQEPVITTNELARMMAKGLDEVKDTLVKEISAVKQELHKEITSVKQELHEEITSTKQELSQKIDSAEYNLRLEMRSGFSHIQNELDEVKDRLSRLEKRSFEDDNALATEVSDLRNRVNALEGQLKKLNPGKY